MNKENINKEYLKEEIIEQMQDFFTNEGFLQLPDFFNKKETKKIKETLLKQKFTEEYKPMFSRLKTLDTKDLYEHDTIMFIEFFKSKDFIEYIENITGFELNIKDINLNLYEHKDFIIINDKSKKEDCIEILYDLSDNIQEEAGAKLTYLTKEEEVLYLDPTFNTLTILYRPTDLLKYLKYINNKAAGKKLLRIEMTLDFIEEHQ